uniref:ARAD1C27720p n=1 Tax=Blastobotrys adeninivorans TaxID=409370 RepID=A0A060T7E7_BLAAD
MVGRRQSTGNHRKAEALIADAWAVLESQSIGKDILSGELIPASKETRSVDVFGFYNDSDAARTSVESKYKKGRYGTEISTLYGDIRFATAMLLLSEHIGSERYVTVDNVFRSWAELVWREVARLGLADGLPEVKQESMTDEDPFETEVLTGFDAISGDLKVPSSEAYWLMTQHGPLFSTPMRRSNLDPREPETHGPIATTSLVPFEQTQQTLPLGYVSPALARIPHPSLPPTEMLMYFQHPVVQSMSGARWLKFDDNESYTPTVDGTGAVITSDEVGSVWYEKLGTKQLATEEDVRQSALESIRGEAFEEEEEEEEEEEGEQGAQNGESEDVEMGDSTKETTDNKKEDDQSQDKSDDKETANPDLAKLSELGLSDSDPVDFVKVLEWTPASFVDDDEFEAAESSTEQELISKMLLQLQTLQRIRLSHNNGTTELIPSSEEKRLALKIQNALARIADDHGPKSIGLPVSSDIPVQQVSYPGVLPAPDVKYNQSRLPGLSSNRGSARKSGTVRR